MFHVPWPSRAGRRDELPRARHCEIRDAGRIVRIVLARCAERYAGLFDGCFVGQGRRRHSCVFAIATRAQTGERVPALEPVGGNRGECTRNAAFLTQRGRCWTWVQLDPRFRILENQTPEPSFSEARRRSYEKSAHFCLYVAL